MWPEKIKTKSKKKKNKTKLKDELNTNKHYAIKKNTQMLPLGDETKDLL